MSPAAPPRQRDRRHQGAPGGIPVGRALGVPISLDLSWFIILALILGTFSAASFPTLLPGQGRLTYLLMGSAGALLFFGSLLIHELAHAVEARRRGIEVEGITLFVFGGMARTRAEPQRPIDEFVIAAVGPLASGILAVLFVGLSIPTAHLGWDPVAVVLRYLGILNTALAVFNLLPGFPLDGGRLLRAAVWGATGSLRTGTRVATRAGRGLGLLLMAVGFLGILGGGGFIGGLWMVFIGWFLMQAAGSSYDQLLLTEVLRGVTAREGMTPDPDTVPPDLPVDTLVHEHFLRRPYSAFPVTDDGIVVGLISLSSVKGLDRDRWRDLRVADIMAPLERTVVVEPDTPMLQVLEQMSRSGNRRALVAHDWELMGIISARDLARWLDRAALVPTRPEGAGE